MCGPQCGAARRRLPAVGSSSSAAHLLGVWPRHDQRPADGPVRGAQLRRHGQAAQRIELRGLPGGGQPQLVLGRKDLELVLARRAAAPAQVPRARGPGLARSGRRRPAPAGWW